MTVVYNVVVAAHLLGMAALVGGYFVALSRRSGGVAHNLVMQRGAEAQVLTGIILVGLAEAVLDNPVNYPKITVKLIVAIVATGLISVAGKRQRTDQPVPTGLVHGAGGLAILNVLIAAIWN